MLHHATLEVTPAELGRAVQLWTTLGFAQVQPPADLAARYTWLQHGGTQIHLMRAESPAAPGQGHIAVVVPDFRQTLERLEESGFEVAPKRERWGSPRAEVIAPGGHRIELMEAPPTAPEAGGGGPDAPPLS